MSAPALIELADALAHLREEPGVADGLIHNYILAASAAILTYIGDNAYTDGTKAAVREDVKTACRLLVGDFYRHRESDNPGAMDSRHGYGFLPSYVAALLFPYRVPALG